MSTLEKLGAAAWMLGKANDVVTWGNIALDATDPATRDDAMYKAATELAELVGIGIPLWFADNLLTKTGLDRVFDSLKQDMKFADYLRQQAALKNIRDAGLGELAEWGLHEFNEWISENGYLDPIFDATSDWWRQAMNWMPPARDPLTLDLDGDGIETLAANGQVLFDHNADGIKEGTGWVGKDDGFLVFDKNANGQIDTGRELFGENYQKADGTFAKDGFDALKDFDSNADGKIDNTDAQWSQLKIWKDANSNGTVEAGELIALGSVNGVGIKQINLANTAASQNVGSSAVRGLCKAA